jgi:hypothetical protein
VVLFFRSGKTAVRVPAAEGNIVENFFMGQQRVPDDNEITLIEQHGRKRYGRNFFIGL